MTIVRFMIVILNGNISWVLFIDRDDTEDCYRNQKEIAKKRNVSGEGVAGIRRFGNQFLTGSNISILVYNEPSLGNQ